MAKSFIIVISIILIVQIVSICSFLRICPVAKAGKVSKFYWKYKLLFGKSPSVINCEGKTIDVSAYKVLYVYGNSMKDYKIRNGQQVLVSEYESMRQKESISDHPVLVFQIYNMKYQSPFKLRKFISYVERPAHTDWNELYDRVNERIKIARTEFAAELQAKSLKIDSAQEPFILSETYDEDTSTHHYSLHPISSLYGEVVYAI